MSRPSALSAILCLCLSAATFAFAEDAAPPADGDLIPIKRVEPKMPREALLKMTNGRVRVAGTVAADGSVTEVHVVESTPPGVYDDATLHAVKQWKFKPRIVDGVAVARPFEQTITYSFSTGRATDRLAAFAAQDRAQAIALHARLRATCPDRYRHADDAANLALRAKGVTAFHDALMTVEPERQSDADAALIRELEPCLFSSWEQLRDAEPYLLASDLSSVSDVATLWREHAAAFRNVASRYGAAPEATAPDAKQLLLVRTWLFNRFVAAYYELINAQAAQFPPATPTDQATTDALDRAKAAMERRQPKEAHSILRKALKKPTVPVDRGLLLLALTRVQTMLGDHEDALASVGEALAIERLPWNLLMTAEMARATLCARTGDTACFDESRTKLHTELGLAEKFAY